MSLRNKKVRSMTVTYTVGDGLYINLTNKCSNRCSFCIRNNGDGAYGSDSLWLEREPTENEILDSVFSHNLSLFSEIVFCGYGEPSYRLDTARSIALEIKRRNPKIKIRINTNGHSSLILGYDSAPLYEGAFDSVSISLNTSNAKKYQDVCHSVYGEKAFEEILKFAQNVKNYVQNVKFSIVRQTLTEEEIEECKKISERCGVELKIRELIT